MGSGRRRGQPGIDGRSSATGPGTIGLYYSGDGVTAALATFNQAPGANFVNSVVDLDSLPGLAGTVEFRLRQVGTTAANGGSTGANGTFRLTGYFESGVFERSAQFTGSVTAIPEPAT
ncbi:MAG: hypothetical protein MUF16_20500, partial [Burkholderiaceae bacterium]|nr:hypothetical protein [Burkholderiaceae bacterium]